MSTVRICQVSVLESGGYRVSLVQTDTGLYIFGGVVYGVVRSEGLCGGTGVVVLEL